MSNITQQYLDQYLDFLEHLEKEGVKVNKEHKDGVFVDKHIRFGFYVFILERRRAEDVLNEISLELDKILVSNTKHTVLI